MLLNLIIFLSSLLFGSMVFFTAIVMPSIFKSLDKEHAQTLAHHLFPRYYLWCIVLSALTTVAAVTAYHSLALLLMVVLIGFIYSRQRLLGKINQARKKWLDTDSPQDKSRYDSLHRRSVIINGFQMVVLLMIVVANLMFYPR
ncbi:MAG: DUF4149 domain-containing protein [Gammaproteobacteria bacterium]|nr:DUF4149 domain-containing protein [Gammaproteobacteria bacterium]MYD75941.1 DUF4149 domain-containing protein [Gammaproteobacteria bacterium]MYJ52325.1 DUF4149 domain-containing protein [Gammaproteobacteria bacterium]